MSPRQRGRIRNPLCSTFSKANHEEPGGTAPSWDRCLVLELAKPWEEEVVDSAGFPPAVLETLNRVEKQGRATRLQCVAPDPEYSLDGHTRTMLYSRPEVPLLAYRSDEFQVPREQTGPLVEALLEHPERLGAFERYRQDTSHIRDIFVCTHGSQDVCCASFGYPIYHRLRHQHARDAGGGLRVWRVSHLGGHRFAPNLLDMPEGRNWVRVGVDDVEPLVFRNRPASDLKQFYRGWVALDSPYEQAAEREVFMREGWGWTGRLVSGQLLSVEDDGRKAQVRIDFAGQQGEDSGAYEATVEITGSAPRVDCLRGQETGDAPQYAVSRLVKVS